MSQYSLEGTQTIGNAPPKDPYKAENQAEFVKLFREAYHHYPDIWQILDWKEGIKEETK
jgi:hypothetical protein